MVQPQEQTGPPAAAWQRGQRREFDLVILGATGFVGRLVVEEIACDYMVRGWGGAAGAGLMLPCCKCLRPPGSRGRCSSPSSFGGERRPRSF